MFLKKRLLAVAALVTLAAAVLYGSTLEMETEEEPAAQMTWLDRKDTLYFWYSDEALTNFVNSAAVTFGEREDVHVIPVLTSGREYLETLNQASLQDEAIPDVYLISNDNLEKAYLTGLASEIRDENNLCSQDNFPKAALDAVNYKGRNVAFPLSFDTSALVYNLDYLREWARQTAKKELAGVSGLGDEQGSIPDDFSVEEEVLEARTEEVMARAIPATIYDLMTIADTFDVPEGVEGVMKWDVNDIFYNYWAVGAYMDVGGDAGDDKTKISIYNEETITCLETYKALNTFFSIDANQVSYESVIQDFMEGKTVFTIATTDVVAKLEEAKEAGTLEFEYGVAMMPDINDELRSRSMSVTNSIAINGYSKQKDLANKFAAFLAGECADSLYSMTGKVPANLTVDFDKEALEIFRMEYAKSVPLPKMMETGNFWLLLERLFAKVWNGEDVTAYVQELNILISRQTQTDQ